MGVLAVTRGLHGCARDPRRPRRGRGVARALAAAVAAAALVAVAVAGGATAHVLYDLHAGEGGAAAAIAAAGGLPAVVAPPDTVVGEADGSVDLEIRLSEPATNPVLVSYQRSASRRAARRARTRTCGSGPDFGIRPGARFSSRSRSDEDSKFVHVPIFDCPGPDGLVSFRLELSNVSSNATIARATTLVSIVSNDTQTSSSRLFVRDAVADQLAGSVQVPVILGGPRGQSSTSPVTVQYTTVDGTGIAGDDYTATSGTLAFAVGQTVKTINVPINANAPPKRSRTFSVTLGNPTGNATVVDGSGTVMIGSSAADPVLTPQRRRATGHGGERGRRLRRSSGEPLCAGHDRSPSPTRARPAARAREPRATPTTSAQGRARSLSCPARRRRLSACRFSTARMWKASPHSCSRSATRPTRTIARATTLVSMVNFSTVVGGPADLRA